MWRKWLSFFLWLFVLLAIGIASIAQISSADIYWLIRDSDYIFTHGTVPLQDIYSYTMAGTTYYHNEILSKALYGIIYKYFSFSALVVLRVAAVVLFGLVLSFAFHNSFAWRYPVLLLVYSGCFSRFILSGELFSPLLLLIQWVLLLRFEHSAKKRYLVYWLISQVVWANVHSGYLMGFVLVGCYAVGAGIDAWWQISQRYSREKSTVLVLFILVAVLCVAIVNPIGPVYLVVNCQQHLFGEYPQAMRTIAHYSSQMRWHFPYTQHFLALSLLFALVLGCRRLAPRQSAGFWSVLLVFAILSYRYPLRAPQYFCVILGVSVLWFLANAENQRPRLAKILLLLASIAALGVFADIASKLSTRWQSPRWQMSESPTTSLRPMNKFFGEQLPPDRWFCEFDVGTRMILQIPQRQTFCDGRIFPFIDRQLPFPRQVDLRPYRQGHPAPSSIYCLTRTLVSDMHNGNLHNSTVEWATTHYQIRTIVFNSYLTSSSPTPGERTRARPFLWEESPHWQMVYADEAVLCWMHKESIDEAMRSYILDRLRTSPRVSNAVSIYRSIIARQLGDYQLSLQLLQRLSRETPHLYMVQGYQNACRLFKAMDNAKQNQITAQLLEREVDKIARWADEELLIESTIALADCWRSVGDLGKARAVLLQLPLDELRYQPPDMYIYLVDVHRRLGLHREANDYLHRGLQRFPTHWLLTRYLQK